MTRTFIALLLLAALLPVCALALDAAGEAAEIFDAEAGAIQSGTPEHDPFRVLVQEPRRVEPPPQPTNADPRPAPAPVAPPLSLSVTGFGGENGANLAVLRYEGSDFLVDEGWLSTDGAFEVRQIRPLGGGGADVVVYDRGAQRLQTVRFTEPRPGLVR